MYWYIAFGVAIITLFLTAILDVWAEELKKTRFKWVAATLVTLVAMAGAFVGAFAGFELATADKVDDEKAVTRTIFDAAIYQTENSQTLIAQWSLGIFPDKPVQIDNILANDSALRVLSPERLTTLISSQRVGARVRAADRRH